MGIITRCVVWSLNSCNCVCLIHTESVVNSHEVNVCQKKAGQEGVK